jgi:hypothetical protein
LRLSGQKTRRSALSAWTAREEPKAVSDDTDKAGMTTLDEIRRELAPYTCDSSADLARHILQMREGYETRLKAAAWSANHNYDGWQQEIARAERAERERDAARDALRRLLKIIGEGGSWRDGVSPLTLMWEITAEEDRELDAALDQAGDALTPSERESTP